MNKRILYITNGISGSGGLERVVSLKASYFADRCNYEVYLITLNENKKAPFYSLSSKVKVLNINTSSSPIKFYYNYFVGIKKYIKEINPDVIFVVDDGLKGVMFATIFRPKCRVIYERHTTKAIHGNNLKAKIIGKLMNFGSQRFDAFVVLTNNNKKDWPKANNLQVIPNPLPFKCDSVPSVATRNRIISVGSLSKVKGHDILIKAWGEIANKFPNYTLHIYGAKKDNYTNLLNLIELHKLMKSVFIHEPVINIQEKYLESCLCILPSRVEGFGMVLIEAMECGVPCIATKCEGPMDIIFDGKNGFLFDVNDSNNLTNILSKVLLDEGLLNQLSSKCRITANQYRIDFIINQWNNLIN